VTRLRFGGIVIDDSVAYSQANLSVNKFRKSVTIWQSYGQYYSGLFLTHSVAKISSFSSNYCTCYGRPM